MKRLFLLTIILLPIMAVSNTIFEKQLENGIIVRFNYALENNQHTWIVELRTLDSVYKLDEFIYQENALPIRLTPDVWQETIYQLFSLLDVILLPNDNLLILYDRFGYVHCKEYRTDTYQSCNTYSIKKYKMSFLFGYNSGYGRMLYIDNMIYTYYSAGAPSRQDFLSFSLTDRKVKEIKFKDTNFLIPAPNIISKLEVEEQLRKIVLEKYGSKKSIDYIGYINDIQANFGHSGIIYHFIYIDNQFNIYRFDIDKKYWMIGDFITNEIKDN